MWRDPFPATPVLAPRPRAARAPVAARIAIVLHDFSGGGTERVAIRLANAWAEAGRSVTIVCGTEAGTARDLVGARVRVVRTDRACVRSLTSRSTLGRSLAGYVADNSQDVVFAPGNFHLPVLARFAAAGTSGATTICKLSNPLAFLGRSVTQRTIYEFALRRLVRAIDGLVAMSPVLRDEARKVLARADIAMAWEPILADHTVCLPRCAALSARPTIVAAGRLEHQKNFALALDAFARSERARDARLVLFGEGSQAKALARRAQRLGIADRVVMPGYRAAIDGDLGCASAFLLTSRYEGYPAVLVEALAAGTPVIATRCSPAIEEIVGDCPASTIVRGDAGSLAAAIDAVLARGVAHSAGSALLVARHSTAAAAAAYLQLLDATHAAALRDRARRLS